MGLVMTKLKLILTGRPLWVLVVVAVVGVTVGDAEGTITQTLLLTQIAAVWAPLAAILYPQA